VLPKKKISTAKDQKRQLLWWKEQLGAHSLADITPSLLAEYRDRLASIPTIKDKRRTPATVVRYLAALSHAFTIAVKEWGWLETNPFTRVSKPREPRGRVRFLSDDERNRLLEACRGSPNPHLYRAVVLAISTGARRMEIMSLRWPQVDFQRGVITLHETKNGDIRVLPLVGHALNLMKDHAKVRRIDTDLVFPGHNPQQPIDLRAPWEVALRRAGIDDFRWHDLRHSCASYLAMNNATLAEIAEVLGHKTLSMVKRYTHLSAAHTNKIITRMNEAIFGGGHE
jgi:integrase